MNSAVAEDKPALSAVLAFAEGTTIDVGTSRVRTAVADASSHTIVAATEGNQILAGSVRVSVSAPVRSLAFARFVAVQDAGLPTKSILAVALFDGAGLALFSLPGLQRVEGAIAEELARVSQNARLFAADAMGGEVVGEAFRLTIAVNDRVILISVNVPQQTVAVLSDTSVSEQVVALAFADMTVVATTVKNHCMLRIARSGGMALAATVPRKDPSVRAMKGAPAGDTGAAVMNFFGGFFARRDSAGAANNQLAFALPENRWVLSINQELVTYSSFGAKLEDMENAFKSKMAIDIPESAVNAALSVVGSPPRPSAGSTGGSVASGARRLPRTVSVSSMASVNSAATTFTAMTLVDEARAKRAEKPPAATVFASPFVLSVTEKNQLLAFAANGSVPGVVASLDLAEAGKPIELGVKIAPCTDGLRLAMVYWPSGRVVEISLAQDLDFLIDEREEHGEFRSALSLVPIDQVDRTIALRRKLAVQARNTDWHDAAIHHMQHVVNLCVAREGVGQPDLIAEAVELRGPKGSSWESDAITATLWADFLYKLRRRIMQASPADVEIIETLCRADVSAMRIKSLLAVKHSVPIDAGEVAITAGDCALHEDDRIEALVALYSSLGEHDKALVLLENSGMNRVFQTVCAYLDRSIRAPRNPNVFFKHVHWVAAESKKSKGREVDFVKLLDSIVGDATMADRPIAERIVQEMMQIVVEQTPNLLTAVVDRMCPEDLIEVSNEDGEIPNETDGKKKIESPAEGESNISENAADPNEGEEKQTEPTSAEAAESTASVSQTSVSITQTEKVTSKEPRVSTDLLAVALLAGMAKADILEDQEKFETLRGFFRNRVLHKEDADYHSERLLLALQASQNQSMALHEELAFLLGRQGRHEAAASELAAEPSLSTLEAERRFEKLLPAGDKSSATQALVAAYLRVSSQERADRIDAAAEVVRREGGFVDVEKILRELDETSSRLTLAKVKPFLQAALVAGNERLRLAELLRALRTSEVRRVREEVLMRRRRCIIIGHDRACSICTRRIGESVFAAYPDGSVTHLVCHMSSSRS